MGSIWRLPVSIMAIIRSEHTLRRPNTVQVEKYVVSINVRETTTTNLRRGDPSPSFGTLVPRIDKQPIIPVAN